MVFGILGKLFERKVARCEEAPLEMLTDEFEFNEEDEIMGRTPGHLPFYSNLFALLHKLTMNDPKSELTGFKFSLAVAPSSSFFSSHEFTLAPKKPQVQTGNPLMDLYGNKTPFYSASFHYNHINFGKSRSPLFVMAGFWDSLGSLNAIFIKPIGNLELKIQSSFPTSNIALSSTQMELNHKSKTSKQSLIAASQMVNYNFLEKIGKNLLIGLELNWLRMKSKFSTGFAMRYNYSPSEQLFVQYSGFQNLLNIGTVHSLGETSSFGTMFELGGMQSTSSASIGYHRKSKKYQVSSSVRTDGDIKSTVFFAPSQSAQIKFFLAGSLWRDDFRIGYAFNIGHPTE